MSAKVIQCAECGISVKSDGAERAVLLLPCQHMIHFGCLEFIQRRTQMQEILLHVTSLNNEELDKDANGEELQESKMQELLFAVPNEVQYSQVMCPACKTIVYRSIPLFTLSESVKRACSFSQESNTLDKDKENTHRHGSVECDNNELSNEEEAFTQVRELQHRYLHQLHHLFKRRRVVAELGQCCATRHEQRTTLLRELDRYHIELPNLLQEYNNEVNSNNHVHIGNKLNENNEHFSFFSRMKRKEAKDDSNTQFQLVDDCSNSLSSLSMTKMNMSELELLLAQSTPQLIETQHELRIERNTLRRRRRKLDAMKKRYQKLKNCRSNQTPIMSCVLQNKLGLMTHKSGRSPAMTRVTLPMQTQEKQKEFELATVNNLFIDSDEMEENAKEQAKIEVDPVFETDRATTKFRSTLHVFPQSISGEASIDCKVCWHSNNKNCATEVWMESELPCSERLNECLDAVSSLQHHSKTGVNGNLTPIDNHNTIDFCNERKKQTIRCYAVEAHSEYDDFSSSNKQRISLEEVRKSGHRFALEEYSSERHQPMTVIDVDDECDSIIVHDISDDSSSEKNDDENECEEQNNGVEEQQKETALLVNENNVMSRYAITGVNDDHHQSTVQEQTSSRICNADSDATIILNFDKITENSDDSNLLHTEQQNLKQQEEIEDEPIRRSCNSILRYRETKQSSPNLHYYSPPSSRVLHTVLQNLPRREDRLWQPSIHFFQQK